eukprot:scaffold2911_cov414-Prasinococcus_capsulatus_cf.AAC.7
MYDKPGPAQQATLTGCEDCGQTLAKPQQATFLTGGRPRPLLARGGAPFHRSRRATPAEGCAAPILARSSTSSSTSSCSCCCAPPARRGRPRAAPMQLCALLGWTACGYGWIGSCSSRVTTVRDG